MIINYLSSLPAYKARRICLVYVPAAFWLTVAVLWGVL